MAPCLVKLLALLGVSAVVRGWSFGSVDELEKRIADSKKTLVAFVSSSEDSLQSQRLEPEWHTAASRAGGDAFFTIDCTAEGQPCEAYGVSRLPAIKLFEGSNPPIEYVGPRRGGAILHFLERRARPTVSRLDPEEFAKFKTVDDVVVVAYLRDEDEAARKAFEDVAGRYRDEFSFGLVADSGVMETERVKPPVVVCRRMIDDVAESFSSFEDPTGLEKWLLETSRPYISELTPFNHQRLLDRGWSMVYVFAETEAERALLRESLVKFAKGYYESLTITTADPLDFPGLPERLGLEPGHYPAGAVHQLSKDRVYPYPRGRGLTSNDLHKWGLDVWQGRVKPWLPPGVTKTYDDLGPTRVAKRTVSVRSLPGFKNPIKIAGHEHAEL